MNSQTFKFAVIQWIDDKYYLETSFIKGFNSFEEAKNEAYKLAEEKSNNENTRISHGKPGYFLKTENEQLNKTKPSPYVEKTIVEYGAEFGNTTYYYSVVDWFDDVTEKIEEYYDVEENVNCYCHSQKYTLCTPCQLKDN